MPRKAACLPAARASVVLARAGDHLKLVRHARERAAQGVQVGFEGACAIRGLAHRVRGDHPGCAADLRFADARKIDLAQERAPQRRAMSLGQVIAERSLPNERIDVQVEHIACAI